MNGNDIISIITNSISAAFPKVKDIYKDNILQDFSTPSFFVSIINSSHKPLIGLASSKRYNVTIKYFPDSHNKGNTIQELNKVADIVLDTIGIMSYRNKTIKAYNVEWKVIDDVLHFMFDIKVKILKDKQVTKFGPLEVNVSVKESRE